MSIGLKYLSIVDNATTLELLDVYLEANDLNTKYSAQEVIESPEYSVEVFNSTKYANEPSNSLDGKKRSLHEVRLIDGRKAPYGMYHEKYVHSYLKWSLQWDMYKYQYTFCSNDDNGDRESYHLYSNIRLNSILEFKQYIADSTNCSLDSISVLRRWNNGDYKIKHGKEAPFLSGK